MRGLGVLLAYILGFAHVALAEDSRGMEEVNFRVTVTRKSQSPPASTPQEFKVQVDPQVCGETRTEDPSPHKAGGPLHGTILWLEGNITPPERNSVSGTQLMAIDKCSFVPGLLFVHPGQDISIVNRDPILHSIRIMGQKNRPLVRVLPPQLKEVTINLSEPEIVAVTSDLHPWMKSYIFVIPHRLYGLTNRDGEATFKSVPMGQFKLNLWHPLLGFRQDPGPLVVNKTMRDLRIEWP